MEIYMFPRKFLRALRVSLMMVIVAMGSSVSAAILAYNGEVHDAGPSVAITYGTDGYDLYSTSPNGTPPTATYTAFGPTRITSLPSYIGAINAAGANYS